MIVPNYVPEPLEVPGNVTEEPYSFRVTYIRRVSLLHLGGVGAVAVLAQNLWPTTGLVTAALYLAGMLLLLDVWRIYARAARVEAIVSAACLPTVLLLSAWVASEASRAGWPVWSPLVGVGAAALYTVLCGRDYSFVGCFLLSLITSSVGIAAIAVNLGLDAKGAGLALLLNGVYLFYFQYDLASLLSRRRRGEECAAVVDLYRDVFNVFGYLVRCVRHWRKHRIWEIAR